jgi:predicted metallo-beta-lactamase superfamily hydrolase
MNIKILGAESLGVRGLSCEVQVDDRRVVIDPGVALGYSHQGLLPHPMQVAYGEQVRGKIVAALQSATDVVISHFHGDHIPLPDANPYQLNAHHVALLFCTFRLWCKGPDGLSAHMASRREALIEIFGRTLPNAEGQIDGPLRFSLPVPHGDPQTSCGTVMMTRIEDKDGVFVHASDIQLLDSRAVELILAWRPNTVLASGPPLHLANLTSRQRRLAWENGLRLARQVDTLIVDHHLLRAETGLRWLDQLASTTGRRVLCAADFMDHPRCLLESRRVKLYKEMPVPEGWHKAYANGDVDTSAYPTSPASHQLYHSKHY